MSKETVAVPRTRPRTDSGYFVFQRALTLYLALPAYSQEEYLFLNLLLGWRCLHQGRMTRSESSEHVEDQCCPRSVVEALGCWKIEVEMVGLSHPMQCVLTEKGQDRANRSVLATAFLTEVVEAQLQVLVWEPTYTC